MDIPAASRRNFQAVVEVDRVTRADGLLTYVTLRPIRRAGDRFLTPAILDSFARRMRSEVYRNIRNQMPQWSDYRIRSQLRLSIFMYNRNNEGRTAAEQDLPMSGITGDTFLQIYEDATAQGSNPDLSIYDIEWKIWINPASLIEGSAQTEHTADEEKDSDKSNVAGVVNFMKLYKDDGAIGCAAHALAIGIDIKERPARKRRHRDMKFTEFCQTLQDRLGFEDAKHATVFELQKFVLLYPSYRLVIARTSITTPFIYEGN